MGAPEKQPGNESHWLADWSWVAHTHVVVDPAVLDGQPHIEGSRVPVARLWGGYQAGYSIDTILKRHPELGPAKILAALAFAYDNRALIELDIARQEESFRQNAQKAQRREDANRARQRPGYGR